MKKYLIYLILGIISLIPILKVNATTSIDNQDVFMNNDINQLMEWIYNSNSTEYLLNLVSQYDYKMINILPNGTQIINGITYNNFTINVIGSNTQEKLWSKWRSGYSSGFLFSQPISKRFDILLKTTDFVTFYNSDRQPVTLINWNDGEYSNLTTSYNLTVFGGVSSVNQDIPYTVYYNNFKLVSGSGTNRPYTLYDVNSNLIGSYTLGDVIPSYIELYKGLPNYLTGYKKLHITPSNVNTMLSGVTSGSVFIPYDIYISQHGTLGYFDKDLSSQPYTSIIEDFYLMPDGLYYRQDFDLSLYPNCEYMAFYKYLYLEGEDTLEYDIYIPNDMYSSTIEGTLDSTNGKYDYTYTYQDENGDIQDGSFTGLQSELLKTSPLLGDMFKNFSTNTFGLTAIVSAPLSLIAQLTGGTCTAISIPIPYTNSNLTLPCMYELYQNTLGSFFNVYQMATFGIISYWVIIKFLNLVKDFKNPDHDEIEVLDL